MINKINQPTMAEIYSKKNDEDVPSYIFADEFFNVHTMKRHPVSQEFINRLAADLIEYADLPDTIRLSDFYNSRGIPNETFYKWKDKFECLNEAYLYSKSRFGAKREDGAIYKRMDAAFISKTIGYYDSIYRQEMIETERIKADKTTPDVNLILTDLTNSRTPEEVAHKITNATKRNNKKIHYAKKVKDESDEQYND